MKEVALLEKYRPKDFHDVVGQQEVVKSLQNFLRLKDIPNMILYGPTGTGKTALVHILLKSIYPNNVQDKVLELNASDDRGIKTVRNVIKKFASLSLSSHSADDELPLRIVFLDEADSMTLDSQYALRRILEDHSKTTRFILTCNYLNRLIEPLVSRCTLLQLHRLDPHTLTRHLKSIIAKENLQLKDKAVKEIVSRCDNLRRAINSLQFSSSMHHRDIDIEHILSLRPKDMFEAIQNILREGMYADTVLVALSNWVINNTDEPFDYVAFYETCTETLFQLSERGNPCLNIMHLMMSLKTSLV